LIDKKSIAPDVERFTTSTVTIFLALAAPPPNGLGISVQLFIPDLSVWFFSSNFFSFLNLAPRFLFSQTVLQKRL